MEGEDQVNYWVFALAMPAWLLLGWGFSFVLRMALKYKRKLESARAFCYQWGSTACDCDGCVGFRKATDLLLRELDQ